MKRLQNYQSFNESRKTNLLLEELMTPQENGAMVKYDSKSFKNFLSEKVNESASYLDDESLNNLHSCYELAMLAELRSNWGSTSGDIIFLEVDNNIILSKNSELFILEKKTIDLVKSVNESAAAAEGEKLSWFQKALDFIDNIGEKAADVSKEIWDKLSSGAKKAWNWLKEVKFGFKDSHGKLDVAKILGLLASVCGLVGAGFPAAIPVTGPVAGVLMTISGFLHIKHGVHSVKDSTKAISGLGVSPVKSFITALIRNFGPFIGGILKIAFGAMDIIQSAAAIANPFQGSIAQAVKKTSETIMDSSVGHLFHSIEHLLGGGLGEEIGKSIFGLCEEAVKSMGKGFATAGVVFALQLVTFLLKKALPWLWDRILAIGKNMGEIASKALEIGTKINDSISKFADWLKTTGSELMGPIGKILAKGLAMILKPATEVADKVISFFQESVDWFNGSINGLIKAQEVAEEMEKKAKEHKVELKVEKIEKPVEKSLIKDSVDKGNVISKDNISKSDGKYLDQLSDENKDSKEVNIEKEADDLYNAMDGSGTREEVIFGVFSKLRGKGHLDKLKYEFGKKDGKLKGLAKKLSLRNWLRDELTSREISKLNKILTDKGLSPLEEW